MHNRKNQKKMVQRVSLADTNGVCEREGESSALSLLLRFNTSIRRGEVRRNAIRVKYVRHDKDSLYYKTDKDEQLAVSFSELLQIENVSQVSTGDEGVSRFNMSNEEESTDKQKSVSALTDQVLRWLSAQRGEGGRAVRSLHQHILLTWQQPPSSFTLAACCRKGEQGRTLPKAHAPTPTPPILKYTQVYSAGCCSQATRCGTRSDRTNTCA